MKIEKPTDPWIQKTKLKLILDFFGGRKGNGEWVPETKRARVKTLVFPEKLFVFWEIEKWGLRESVFLK